MHHTGSSQSYFKIVNHFGWFESQSMVCTVFTKTNVRIYIIYYMIFVLKTLKPPIIGYHMFVIIALVSRLLVKGINHLTELLSFAAFLSLSWRELKASQFSVRLFSCCRTLETKGLAVNGDGAFITIIYPLRVLEPKLLTLWVLQHYCFSKKKA